MLINIIVTLVIVGVILYLINSFVPMDNKIRQLLNVVVILVLAVWCLQALGMLGSIGGVGVR